MIRDIFFDHFFSGFDQKCIAYKASRKPAGTVRIYPKFLPQFRKLASHMVFIQKQDPIKPLNKLPVARQQHPSVLQVWGRPFLVEDASADRIIPENPEPFIQPSQHGIQKELAILTAKVFHLRVASAWVFRIEDPDLVYQGPRPVVRNKP